MVYLSMHPDIHRSVAVDETLMMIGQNRITIHNASWDYEGSEPRHGTRVTALAEKPLYEDDAPTRRQALGLAGPNE